MVDKEKGQTTWKTYPEYPFIEANQFGEIRTKNRTVIRSDGSKYYVKGRVLKQQLLPNGYLYVHVRVNDKQVNLYVHRIVAVCFLPNPNNLPEVNHIDNDRANNVASNLEWCTHQYNIDYKKNFGKSSAEALGRPVIAINQETSEVFLFKSRHEAARQLGFFHQNIIAIINGKQNTAGGYSFINVDENAVKKAKEKFSDEVAKKVEKLMREI